MPHLEGFELALYFLTAFIQIFVFLFGGYYIFISIFGWSNKKTNTEPETKNLHRFALLVAAHNEEMVISNMVKSLQNLNYPREYYDIFVIADNCNDETAERAREAGALVYERTNNELRGKGYALEWMFEKIFEMGDKYDFISIFDADNVVNKNYLQEMNKEVNKGYEVVLSSGSTPIVLNKFDEFKQTMTADEVLMGKKFPGRKIVILGGGSVGCETADYLAPIVHDKAPRNREIIIIEAMKEEGVTKEDLGREGFLERASIILTSVAIDAWSVPGCQSAL